MIEKLTVDVVANAITEEVLTGEPRSRLTHRFFRKGRRDGRRRMSERPVMATLQFSVQTAESRIVEQLRANLAAKNQRLAELRQELGQREEKTETAPVLQEAERPSKENVPGQLAFAEAARKAAAQQKVYDAEYEEALEEYEAHRRRIDELNVEISGLEIDVDALEERSEQQRATCRQVGQFLWASYLRGYEYGQTRIHLLMRLLRLAKDEPPRTDLPEALEFAPMTPILSGQGGAH